MRIYKTTLLICVAILSTHCTLFQKKKSPQPIAQKIEIKPIEQPPAPIVQPEFVSPEVPTQLGDATIKRDEAPIATVPLSTFTSRELEHIKFATYDPFPGTSNSFSLNLAKVANEFTYPLNNGRFSSGYGWRGRKFHSGVDILESAGAPVYAAFDGVVRISKPYGGYGNVIVIRHDNGLETLYSHNSKNLVKAGQKVKSGDKIAAVGRTGTASANHLHFEVRVLGQTINPMLLIDPHKSCLQNGTLLIKRSGSSIVASNSKSDVKTTTKPSQPTVAEVSVSTTNSNTSSTTSATSSGTRQYHTIVSGDTLSRISKKYGTSVLTLCQLNNINEKTILSLGRKLVVK